MTVDTFKVKMFLENHKSDSLVVTEYNVTIV